eukprot:c2035_g1_i1.p1 GENE.c2035_g1_i1~~c2035_g1_i1.p1  ORF type:complete len:619 (+),score=154.54 c2035_g1_i1:57-1859(+)
MESALLGFGVKLIRTMTDMIPATLQSNPSFLSQSNRSLTTEQLFKTKSHVFSNDELSLSDVVSFLRVALNILVESVTDVMTRTQKSSNANIEAVAECFERMSDMLDHLGVLVNHNLLPAIQKHSPTSKTGLTTHERQELIGTALKLKTMSMFLVLALESPKDDVVSWHRILRVDFEYRDKTFDSNARKQMDSLLSLMDVNMAAIVDTHKMKNKTLRNAFTFGAMTPYWFQRQKSRARASWGHSIADVHMAQHAWNVPCSGVIPRVMSMVTLPSIKTHHIFHVPCSHPLRANDDSAKKVSIPVRLLCGQKMPFSSNCVVLHLHGGGFIAMNTFSHQSYTRRWAIALGNVPVFSVDYRKAPQCPYPAALDDCFSVYMWILANAESTFGCRPDRIVVVGDSAGGNLAACVTLRAILENVKVPNGCLLAYPVLHLDLKYTPSYLQAVDDRMLPYSLLLVCLEAYAPPDKTERSNCLLSPLLAPTEVLSRFPPTRIMVGDHDPFHDDCVRFAYRLFTETAHKNVLLRVHEGVNHGFLSLAMKGIGVKVFGLAVDQAGKYLNELLGREGAEMVQCGAEEEVEEVAVEVEEGDFDGNVAPVVEQTNS